MPGHPLVADGMMSSVGRPWIVRWVMLVVGSALLGLASAMVVAGNFGFDPYSSAVVAVSRRFNVGLTVASLLFFALLVVVAAFRVRPSWGGTLVAPVVLSVVLGLAASGIGHVDAVVPRVLLVAGSLVPAAFGIVFYLSANLGASPSDAVVLAVTSERVRYPVAMTVVFAGFCLFAFLVAGVLPGATTLVSLTCMGPSVAVARRVCERFGLSGFPNAGVPQVRVQAPAPAS